MPVLHVLRPGMLTTIQDAGRWGWQAQGVSVAGPMDPYAYRLANALVGNSPRAAALEVTLAGPELECEDERVVAVTGAEFELALDNRPVRTNTAFVAQAGSRLRFGARYRGARSYVAISGGVVVPQVLGSRATHVLGHMGGLAGRPLRAGDRLPLGEPPGGGNLSRPDVSTVIPDLGAERPQVRVLSGPHLQRFVHGALDRLQSGPYVVEAASDRMGFRLRGPGIDAVPEEMISEAVPLGALQVPASGQPVLLMADRQTTGGYPIVATVISADIGVAGQLCPGDSVWFAVCSRQEALAALIARERPLMALEARVNP
jgi:antagonist of KipI